MEVVGVGGGTKVRNGRRRRSEVWSEKLQLDTRRGGGLGEEWTPVWHTCT